LALTANSLLPADTKLDFQLLFRHECGGGWIQQITFFIGLAQHAMCSWERWQNYAALFLNRGQRGSGDPRLLPFSGCGEGSGDTRADCFPQQTILIMSQIRDVLNVTVH